MSAESAASAPAKAILVGEHFVMYGSGALVAAVDWRASARARRIAPGSLEIASGAGALSAPLEGSAASAPEALRPLAHVAEEAARRGLAAGLRIEVESDLPQGAGLGSSSACCAAAAAAALGLSGAAPGRADVLRLAVDAERAAFRGASGADTTACVHGGVTRFRPGGGFERASDGAGLELVVADSGRPHSTARMAASVARFRRRSPAEFERMLGRVASLVGEARDAAASGDAGALGRCMSENQEYLERIGVSNASIRRALEAAEDECHGAKLTGAGGGGCVVCLPRGGPGGAAAALERAGFRARAVRVDAEGVRAP